MPVSTTPSNVDFNGVLTDCVVLDTQTGLKANSLKTLLIWDCLNADQQAAVNAKYDAFGGTFPAAGYQQVDFSAVKAGGDATGLLTASSAYQSVQYAAAIGGGDATGLTPDTAGYQTVRFAVDLTGASATGLTNDATQGVQTVTSDVAVAATDVAILAASAGTYYFKVDTDGAGVVEYSIVTTADTTYAQVAALLQAAWGLGTVTFNDANDQFIFVSSTYGATSSVAVTAGTTGTDVFAQIVTDGAPTSFTYDAAVAGVDGTATYTASINVDGGAIPISVTGWDNQTVTDLLATLNGASNLNGAATASLTSSGDIVVTSATTGTSSTVVITDTDLFSSLTNYTLIGSAHTGTTTTYAVDIYIDGTVHHVSVVGNDAQTFTTLVSEINADLPGAYAAIVGSTITITSPSSPGSVYISGDQLFLRTTGFYNYNSPVAGVSGTYTVTVTVNGVDHAVSVTGSAANTFTNLLTEINTDLNTFATATLVSGNIVITADAAPESVVIKNDQLFRHLTDYFRIESPVAGVASLAEAIAGLSLSGCTVTRDYKPLPLATGPIDYNLVYYGDDFAGSGLAWYHWANEAAVV